MIHVCFGTQAELIKLAGVLRALADLGAEHRIVDTGQHGLTARRLLEPLGLRQPDAVLYDGPPVTSSARAAAWMASLGWMALTDRPRLRTRGFAPGPGVVCVHGDTFTTLAASALARMLGLKLAHVESGLRSYNWRHPFPEEIVRVITNRWADVLFPPGAWAADNLRAMGVRGRIVPLPVNTGRDALDLVLRDALPNPHRPPYAVASLHRFETLVSAALVRQAVEVVVEASKRCPVVWPMHTVMRQAVEKAGLMPRLQQADVRIGPILDYPQFAPVLRDASFVIADGGSIQEECYFLDKPCLLLRRATERREGLGENVVLSGWDAATIEAFLADPASHRRQTPLPAGQASRIVAQELVQMDHAARGATVAAAGGVP